MAVPLSVGLENIVEDTTPQLGGALDVNGSSIVSVSDGDIALAADGAGQIEMSAAAVCVQMEGTCYERFNVSGNLGFERIPNVSLTQAQAISLVENLAGGTLPAGEYHYDVTFITDEGDTATIYYIHDIGNVPDITVSANSSVTINNIPVSTSSRCTGRRIWRVELADQVGYICRPMYDLNDNSTTSWTDDGSLTPSGGLNYQKDNKSGGRLTLDNIPTLETLKPVTVIGYQAAPTHQTYSLVAVGQFAGENITTAAEPTCIGHTAGRNLTTGGLCTFIGSNAGLNVSTQVENTWIGSSAFPAVGADGNTAIGCRAGFFGPHTGGQTNNLFAGRRAGYYLNGSSNVVLGAFTGNFPSSNGTTCNYCIFVGALTGQNANGANYSILIGYDLDLSAAGADYEVNVGTLFFGNYASGSEYAAFRFDKPYYFGAGNDASLQYDGTDFKITTDHVAASDLVIDCGTEKTLELVEPVTADIPFSLTGARVPASNNPTWASYSTNTNRYTFAVNDYIDFGDAEINHDWKEGDTIEMHLHWITNGANDGTARKCNWIAYYTMGDMEEAMDAEANVTAEDDIPASEADRTHHYLHLGDITMTGKRIGCTMNIRLKRIACTGTEPANDPFVAMVGVHYRRNTLGSRQEGVK